MQNKFFGSKLNSILLIILIILMFIAIYIMLQNKEVYFSAFQKPAPASVVDQTQEPIPKENLLGNKDDLISFSIWPNTKVQGGIVSFRGVIKGGYFFEGNILINILDMNKKVLKQSNAVAKTDWMTAEPVSFEGNIDFTGLSLGPAYFEIHNDNPSDLREYDKSILIPIIIN
jgi:hypothetical protein